MNDEIQFEEKVFEMLSPEEMEAWVADFVLRSDGQDFNAVCTLAMMTESMDAFINKDDRTREAFMKFSLRRDSEKNMQFYPLYDKYQTH
tara:strand:- start:8370 stop:8636 length:267 start_codon:yes stop_codon:yes gene_type:complete